MTTLEEYKLAYALYEEGRALEATEISYELKALTENNMELIEEGMAENIKNYIQKIVTSIQSVWSKFKDNVLNHKSKHKIEEIEKATAVNTSNITIDNYAEFDPAILDTVKIQPLQYNTMKDSLTDKETFLKKYYGSFYSDTNKSVYDNLKAKCIVKKEDKHAVTKEELLKMVAYTKTHFQIIKKMDSDINSINSSARNADNVSNSLTESAFIIENSRAIVLATAIKVLEDEGVTPKITERNKKQWVDTGSSGHFGNSLCIAGLGNDSLKKYCYAVNKVIKPMGGNLSPDNYGTAFLTVKENYLFEMEGEPENKVSSEPKEENKPDVEGKPVESEKKEDSPAKKIQVYFKCTSDILSAKMKLSREIYSFYSSVINAHMNNASKATKNKEEPKADNNVKVTTGTPQIK